MASLLLWLSACSHDPARGIGRADGASDVTSEKSVIRALSDVEASDQQRLAVLAAFDREDAQRGRLRREAEDLRRTMSKLPKTEPDYVTLFGPLAQRAGELVTEQLLIQARFDQSVASILSAEQFSDWQAVLRHADGGGRGGLGGQTGARRGPGPGGL